MVLSVRRPQYFISHTKSHRSFVMRHRLSCEKVNLHNTLITWAWSLRGQITKEWKNSMRDWTKTMMPYRPSERQRCLEGLLWPSSRNCLTQSLTLWGQMTTGRNGLWLTCSIICSSGWKDKVDDGRCTLGIRGRWSWEKFHYKQSGWKSRNTRDSHRKRHQETWLV